MKNLQYTFAVVTHGNSFADFRCEPLFSTRNEKEVAELKRFLLEQNAGFRRAAQGRNSREVVVVAVDGPVHQEWLTNPGRNGLVSKPAKRGMVFRSATEASGYIGLKHNEVAMALSRMAATGSSSATIRGVTFAYKDETK